MENNNGELNLNEQVEETNTNTNETSKPKRLSFGEYRPPKAVYIIPDSQTYDLEKTIQKHLDYNESCRARGRVAAGKHRAG